MDLSLALLESQLKQLSANHAGLFAPFKAKRDDFDDIIRRHAKVVVDKSIEPYAAGVDVQSPDLLRFLEQYVNVLTINPTKIDCTSLDVGSLAKDDVEDDRLWLASGWRKLNKNRYIDRATGNSQVRYGVAIWRFGWAVPPEPEEGKDRESYFKEYKEDVFKLEVLNPKLCSWFPLKDPKLFILEMEIPYIEATKLRDENGNWLNLDQAGKAVFLGTPQPVNESTSQNISKKLIVVTRAMEDPETGEWHMSEYIYNSGGKASDAAFISDVVCPLPRCPFFIIPSGSEEPLETDPSLRFVPTLLPLIIAVQENNFLRTTILAMGIKFSSQYHQYIDISSLKPEHLAFLQSVFPVEGAGASQYLVFDLPEPGSNQLTVAPHIEAFPSNLSEGLTLSLEINQQNIKDYAPSRWLTTGNADRGELDMKATTMVDLRQAGSVPFSNLLLLTDAGIAEVLEAMACCVRYWDEGVTERGRLKLYPVTATGGEPLAGGLRHEIGKQVFIDAMKLRRPYEITVLTKNMTQAEEMQSALMAYQDDAHGLLTPEQLVAARGFEDPRRQIAELEKARLKKLNEPNLERSLQLALGTLFFNLTSEGNGEQVAALLGMQVPQPPAPAQQTTAEPGRRIGQAPQWYNQPAKAGRMAPQPLQAGPAVTPSPMDGPQGGNVG